MLAALYNAPSPLRSSRGVDIDFPLIAGCLALLGLGLVMITSASSEVAASMSGNPFYHMLRHLVYLGLGLGAAVLTLFVPMSLWQRFSLPLVGVALLLLVLVLIPGIGRQVNGASRWIGFGFFNLQPSELAKLFCVLFLASYMVRHQKAIHGKMFGFVRPLALMVPFAVLLLAEPDFGATVVLMGSCVAMLFLGGIKLSGVVPLIALVLGVGGWVMFAESYRIERLMNFIDPWADQYGAGYQLSQALIAFGRGEWFGLGLGNSIQKQFYLPEAHTDFVFSVLAEELGVFGSLATVGLFTFVAIRALYIGMWAEQAKQYFSAYVAYGIAIQWAGQMLINIGVNIGLLPTKGLTLPFLSYGGSSLIVCSIGLAMLLRIEWERRTALSREEVEFTEADFFDVEEVKHAR